MQITFEAIAGAGLLPANYLPAAFAAIQGQGAGQFFPLIPAPPADAGGGPRQARMLGAAQLADPAAVAAAIAELGGGTYFVGPPSDSAALPDFSVPAGAAPDAGTEVLVAAIIDAGTAFWNPCFDHPGADGGGTRFAGAGFLEFSKSSPAAPALTFLSEAETAACIARARVSGGERRLIEELGTRFPGSVFGRHPKAGRLFRPEGMNHGTAVADLAAGSGGGSAARIFSLELPAEAWLDASGGTLQSVLGLALEGLINQVSAWAAEQNVRPRLRVVMPMACLGGPLDGSHPAAAQIADILDRAAVPGTELIVPMGNHLQDQAHARLPDTPAGQTSLPLRWFLPPDDHVSNTIEIFAAGAIGSRLLLTSPCGATASCQVAGEGVALLKSGSRVLGALSVQGWNGGRHCLRLTLAQTAGSPSKAPFGEWQAGFEAGAAALTGVCAWVLREDGRQPALRLPPSRQARFRDAGYVRQERDGRYRISDDGRDAQPVVRRAGTASPLTTAAHPALTAAAAVERTGAGQETRLAWYSGRPFDGSGPDCLMLVDEHVRLRGQPACGNGSARQFRLSGTSAAAALALRAGWR